jgi:predicted nucleotidyltransferase
MSVSFSVEQVSAYRLAAQERTARRHAALSARRQAALIAARGAAGLLKTSFGATRVLLFGSVAAAAGFHERSDIDLAVEGVPPDHFWRAWAALDDLGSGFEIDLVDLTYARQSLVDEVARSGIEL